MKRQAKYKDTLFRSTFKVPERALRLYNIVSGSNYPADTTIEVTNLDKNLSINKENDVSFVLGDKLIIFLEHQSTVNNNMPLRFLEYLACNYNCLKSKLKYERKLLQLPKPEFYVLYNGREKWNAEYLRLSDAFSDAKIGGGGANDTFIELVAKIVNIKPDNPTVDIKADNELYVYSLFVSYVQEYTDKGESIVRALNLARKRCAQQGLTASVLSEEANDMFLEEMLFNEQEYLNGREDGKQEGRQEGRQDGKQEGRQEGRQEGETNIIQKLLKGGFDADAIFKATGIDPASFATDVR